MFLLHRLYYSIFITLQSIEDNYGQVRSSLSCSKANWLIYLSNEQILTNEVMSESDTLCIYFAKIRKVQEL